MTKWLLFCIALVPSISVAQAAPLWNEDALAWNAPAMCADGSNILNCPVTGYRVEEAPTATATTWTLVGTTNATTTSFVATNRTVGQHCYRVIALAATNSAPSNVACTTTVAPPPGPPTLKTVDTLVYDIIGNRKLGRLVASVAIGTPCGQQITGDYYEVSLSDVTLTRQPRSSIVVAKCAAS